MSGPAKPYKKRWVAEKMLGLRMPASEPAQGKARLGVALQGVGGARHAPLEVASAQLSVAVGAEPLGGLPAQQQVPDIELQVADRRLVEVLFLLVAQGTVEVGPGGAVRRARRGGRWPRHAPRFLGMAAVFGGPDAAVGECRG